MVKKDKEFTVSIDRNLIRRMGYYNVDFVDYTPPDISNNYVGKVGIDLTKRYVIHFKDIEELNRNIEKLLKQLMKQNRG